MLGLLPSARLAAVVVDDDHAVGNLRPPAGRETLGELAPRGDELLATATTLGLALAATVGVIDRVHGHAAHMRAAAQPAGAAGLAEGVLHLTLLGAGSAPVAMVLLALAGIPEILSTASWFTAAQTRLTPQQQAILFTFSAPIWDLAYAIGTFSGGLHAQGGLSLSGYWALVSLSSSLPLVPLLVMRRARAAA